MEIDRSKLISLLEALVDTSELLQRELMLYQLLFYSACKTSGLTQKETEESVSRGRAQSAERIQSVCEEDHKRLLETLPLLVDMLASDQDAAIRWLKEWNPRGLPN
jgi:hypothetical protein